MAIIISRFPCFGAALVFCQELVEIMKRKNRSYDDVRFFDFPCQQRKAGMPMLSKANPILDFMGSAIMMLIKMAALTSFWMP